MVAIQARLLALSAAIHAHVARLADAARRAVSWWPTNGYGVIASAAVGAAAGIAFGWYFGHASGSEVADAERQAHASAAAAHRHLSSENTALSERLLVANVAMKRMADELEKRPPAPVTQVKPIERPATQKRTAPAKPVAAQPAKPMPWW